MASPGLTVRNLTASSVELQRFEVRQGVERPQIGGTWRNMTRNVTSHLSGAAYASLQNISATDLEKAVPSFGSVQVEASRKSNETLLLHLQINNENYLTSISRDRSYSQYLMPSNKSTSPAHEYVKVYHPQNDHLFITSHLPTSSWMAGIRDEVPLSILSIPGTHNSPACHHALPSVRCQAVSVMEQLTNGVRFFDIRVQPKHPGDPQRDELQLVHSVFPISLAPLTLYFRPMVTEMLNFLSKNASETIIISLKREGTGHSTDEDLSRILHDHYAKDDLTWFTAPRIPRLGEARGKIVVIRRFGLDNDLKQKNGGSGWCIDAGGWADNTPNSTTPSGQICVQDFYQVMEKKAIQTKIQYSIEHLKRAATSVYQADPSAVGGNDKDRTKSPFYINFLTASNLWSLETWPRKIAAKLNPAILEYLCLHHRAEQDAGASGSGSTGIVVCDWIGSKGDWDLAKCIVAMNIRLEKVHQPIIVS